MKSKIISILITLSLSLGAFAFMNGIQAAGGTVTCQYESTTNCHIFYTDQYGQKKKLTVPRKTKVKPKPVE